MKLASVTVTVFTGVLLLVLSIFWVGWFPGTSRWTPEKASEWAKVKDHLHNISFKVNSPTSKPTDEMRAEYDRVKQRSTQLQQEFESAYNGPRTTATVLKWTGLSLLAAGGVGLLVLNNRSG